MVRGLSELQRALDALAEASGHLEAAAQEGAAAGVGTKLAGAKGLLTDLQQEVTHVMRLLRGEG
jgi:hypothetical protein